MLIDERNSGQSCWPASKYNGLSLSMRLTLEVIIPAHFEHGGQQFGQWAPRWGEQGRRQDGAVFGPGAAAMGAGPLFEGLHYSLLHTAYR
jgi:hypothetical protein